MNKNRLMVLALAGGLLLSGFAFGRMADTPRINAAEENKAPITQAAQPAQTSSENQAFYLSDFKTGYTEGFNAGSTGAASGVISTDRAGYNEGFKQGYADGFQTKAVPEAAPIAGGLSPAPVAFRPSQQVNYRPASAPARKGNSKLKTALTIAAPAAVGAGVGAMVGGKKGAGVGALLGGGGGALYHLYKNRDRN